MDTLLSNQVRIRSLEVLSDEVLAARALHDPDAFTVLYRAYALDVFRYCRRRMQDQEAAEDATSQTFVNAYADLHRLGRKPFRPWLFAIAHNVVVDAHRSRRSHFSLEVADTREDPALSPEAQAIDRERANLLQMLLSQLPKRDREVVEFHTLDEPARLSPTFFQELEARLAEVSPLPLAPRWWNAPSDFRAAEVDLVPADGNRRSAISKDLNQVHPRSIHWPNRGASFHVALAIVAVLLIAGGVALAQALPRSSEEPAIPAVPIAQPTVESMFELDFVPALFGMPEATSWTQMNFNLVQLGPGESFTTNTDWYTAIDGPLLFVVLSGVLAIKPAGPALFVPDGQTDQTLIESVPGESLVLGPGAAIAYSATDSATGGNPGIEPLTALQVSIGRLAFVGPGTESAPLDFKNLDRQQDWGMDAPPTAGAALSIRHLRLEPFDSFVFAFDPDLMYWCVFDQFQMDDVWMASGALETLSPDIDKKRLYTSTELTYPEPGPHTIFNFGSEPVDFYFFEVEPLPDKGALET